MLESRWGSSLRVKTPIYISHDQVHGKEWSFGEEGISCQAPREHEVHVYRTSIQMGTTCYSEAQLKHLMLRVMAPQWREGDYDMLERNCCSDWHQVSLQ